VRGARARAEYQRQLAEHNSAVAAATADTEERNPKMAAEHKRQIEKLTAHHREFLAAERGATKASYQKMADARRRHSQESANHRTAIEETVWK
jgi:hypothetical protein